MPVIAINVSKQVHDSYHSIKSGKRSERMNNALERHFRLVGMTDYNDMGMESVQLKITEREDNIMKLQKLITDLHNEIENKNNEVEMLRSKSLFQRIFRWN